MNSINPSISNASSPLFPAKRESRLPLRTVRALRQARESVTQTSEADTDLKRPLPPRIKNQPRRKDGEPPTLKSSVPLVEAPKPQPEPAPRPEAAPEPSSANESTPIQDGNSLTTIAPAKAHAPARMFWIVAFVAAVILSYLAGVFFGHPAPEAPVKAPLPTFPADAMPQLDSALKSLREGDAGRASEMLQSLVRQYPEAPSLLYANALASVQNGDWSTARKFAEQAVSKNDRRSDALALLAAIDAMSKSGPSTQQQDLLRQAIAADPMNANPMLELATILRYKGKLEEAAPLLESARLRLLPVDSHAAIKTTIELTRWQQATEYPKELPITGRPETDFPAAYVAMKNGDFETAAVLYAALEKNLDPDLFSYLVNDPALRRFAHEQKMAKFYR